MVLDKINKTSSKRIVKKIKNAKYTAMVIINRKLRLNTINWKFSIQIEQINTKRKETKWNLNKNNWNQIKLNKIV